jgi:hypothetical protein
VLSKTQTRQTAINAVLAEGVHTPFAACTSAGSPNSRPCTFSHWCLQKTAAQQALYTRLLLAPALRAARQCGREAQLQQECLGLTDEEMRAEVVAFPSLFSYRHIEEKWALMMSRFAEEEGGQKQAALRKLGPR